MSGLEQVTSSVEDILIDSLQFKPNPSASYITSRKDTRWYQAGSDSYSSDSGVKVIRWSLTGAVGEFLDPQSVRISMDVTNTGALPLEPTTGPWGLFQRLSIRCLGTLTEDVNHYNFVHQIFSTA